MSSIPPNTPHPPEPAAPSAYRDNCPECLTGPYEPYETKVRETSLVGAYRCIECDHTWTCWWNVSTLPADQSSAGDVA